MNKACLLGNVGKDPEIRYTQAGDPVASFSIATTERWKKDGERMERTEWHNVTVFGALAKIVKEYVSKGKQLYVEGSLRTEEYEKDGQKRRSTKVILSGPNAKLVLLGGNRGDNSNSGDSDNSGSGDGWD